MAEIDCSEAVADPSQQHTLKHTAEAFWSSKAASLAIRVHHPSSQQQADSTSPWKTAGSPPQTRTWDIAHWHSMQRRRSQLTALVTTGLTSTNTHLAPSLSTATPRAIRSSTTAITQGFRLMSLIRKG